MKKNYGYPSYNLICKATSGDEKAIREILDFYNAYYAYDHAITQMVLYLCKLMKN